MRSYDPWAINTGAASIFNCTSDLSTLFLYLFSLVDTSSLGFLFLGLDSVHSGFGVEVLGTGNIPAFCERFLFSLHLLLRSVFNQ